MRVGELLAVSAICLLVLAGASCDRVDQPVGVYSEPALGPSRQPAAARAGSPAETDAAQPGWPPLDTSPVWADPDAGPIIAADGGRPSGWLPPMLGDAASEQPPVIEPGGCTFTAPLEAERRRLDMYIVMDSNITLPATGLWERTTEGLRMFVDSGSSRGIGVGIKYFGVECSPAPYAEADVEVNLLPGNAPKLSKSTSLRRLNASPMLPALQGGIMHARERARMNPAWKQIVVLVSDGFTQDLTCAYSAQDLEDAARSGLLGLPSIETHVIGVGVTTSVAQLDEWITRFGAFDGIAQAGGSREALTTDINADATVFNEQLQTVRREAQPCEYAAPQAVPIDQFGVARWGVGDEVPRVASPLACRNLQGWYYSPTRSSYPVVMCDATCDWLREADDHSVVMLAGCPATTRN